MRTPRLAHLLIASLALTPPAVIAAETSADKEIAFPRPDNLLPAIGFWTRVYTEVDTNSGFVHDNRELGVIYQVLRLNPYVAPAVQDKAIERAIERYRHALLALADGKRTGLTRIESRALGAWRSDAPCDDLRSAAERVRFQRGQSNRFKKGLIRSNRWQGRIKELFLGQGLPPELVALPHLESSYNPDARSKAGAAGLWQLMPGTAQRYLRVDDAVDERLDPYKSSEAAACLLEHNYAVLKSWPLALTAYNYGLSGMWRAVQEAGTTDIGEIVSRYDGERFGFASRNFYAAFLAAVDVSRSPTQYFGDRLDEPDADPIAVTVPAYLPVDALTEAFEIDREYLRALNPSLPGTVWSDDKFVPKDYRLRLPAYQSVAEAEGTLQMLARTAGYASQKPDVYHEVQPGESLSVIAEKYDTSVVELVAMNRLQDRHRIRAGDKLLVATGPAPERLSEIPSNLAATKPETNEELAATDTANADSTRSGDAGVTKPAAEVLLVAKVTEATPVNTSNEPDDLTETAQEQITDGEGPPVESQPELAADPADYSVGADGTITIQVAETLGHYADWLGLRSTRLQQVNGLKDGEPLIVGHRLKLDFSNVDRKGFEQRRISYHQSLQAAYFRRFHIYGVREHRLKDGENLWILATRQYEIPLWLLRQYNPAIDFHTVLPPGEVIAVPIVQG